VAVPDRPADAGDGFSRMQKKDGGMLGAELP